MRLDSKLSEIVQTAVELNQVGDSVMTVLDAIEKRLRKGGVTTEVWLSSPTVSYNEREWALGFARFDNRYRLAVREANSEAEPGYAMPLKHSPRLLRLRAASHVDVLLDQLLLALRAQVDEAAAAASSAEHALYDIEETIRQSIPEPDPIDPADEE